MIFGMYVYYRGMVCHVSSRPQHSVVVCYFILNFSIYKAVNRSSV